jgi:hypothetical protein
MIRRTFISASLCILSLCVLTASALAGSKPAPNKGAFTVVDQGSFGVFQNGRRVATETFTIRQYAESSITSSDLHGEAGQVGGLLGQTSELTLLPDGSLSRYEWKQTAPVRSSATVEPRDQFLTMHIVVDGKASDQPFFLTPEAFVLDDYFFSTREVLLWRYLATACKERPNGDGCDLIRSRFPVLVPRRRTSSQVFIEFKGYDDTPLNGRPQHLRHFLIQTDGPEWHLWLDSNQKLLRISIPDTNTEILRQDK